MSVRVTSVLFSSSVHTTSVTSPFIRILKTSNITVNSLCAITPLYKRLISIPFVLYGVLYLVEVSTESLPPQVTGDWVLLFGTFGQSFVETQSLKSVHLELNLQPNASCMRFTERVMFM